MLINQKNGTSDQVQNQVSPKGQNKVLQFFFLPLISKSMLLQPTEIVYKDTKSFQYNSKKLDFWSLMELGYTHWFFTFSRKKIGDRFKTC